MQPWIHESFICIIYDVFKEGIKPEATELHPFHSVLIIHRHTRRGRTRAAPLPYFPPFKLPFRANK